MDKLTELSLLLDAIKATRELADKQPEDDAIMQHLLNLYACIGSNSGSYIDAINGVIFEHDYLRKIA